MIGYGSNVRDEIYHSVKSTELLAQSGSFRLRYGNSQ